MSDPEQRVGYDEPARGLPGFTPVFAGSRLWRGGIFLSLANPAIVVCRVLGVTARRLTPEELDTAFEVVKALSGEFPVLNPVASIEDMQRHLRGEPETFGCLAGWKSFYLDWHLQL